MVKAKIISLLAGFILLLAFVSIPNVSAYFFESGNVEGSSYNFDKWTITEDIHKQHSSITITHSWSSPSYSASFEQAGAGVNNWQPVVLNNQPPRNSEQSLGMALNSYNIAKSKRFGSYYNTYYYSGYMNNYWS